MSYTYRFMGVIPRQITQGPTCTVSDVSEKMSKNTSMCSNDTNNIIDADHLILVFKAKIEEISSDTHQLQLIKLHHFKLERFKSI